MRALHYIAAATRAHAIAATASAAADEDAAAPPPPTLSADLMRCLERLFEPASEFYLAHAHLSRDTKRPTSGSASLPRVPGVYDEAFDTLDDDDDALGDAPGRMADGTSEVVSSTVGWLPELLAANLRAFAAAGGFRALVAAARVPASLGLAGLTQLLTVVGAARELLDADFQTSLCAQLAAAAIAACTPTKAAPTTAPPAVGASGASPSDDAGSSVATTPPAASADALHLDLFEAATDVGRPAICRLVGVVGELLSTHAAAAETSAILERLALDIGLRMLS